MAKIENTTAYPNIIPTANDYLLLTDVNDNNATKTSKVTDFQKFFGVSTLETTISAAEVLGLFSNPKVLLTASAGEYIQPLNAVIKYVYKTGAFTFANQLYLTLGTTAANVRFSIPASSLFNGIQNVTAWFLEPASAYEYANPAGGDSLTLRAGGLDPTGPTAEGHFVINIQYRIIKF